jgi:hypothetical protein
MAYSYCVRIKSIEKLMFLQTYNALCGIICYCSIVVGFKPQTKRGACVCARDFLKFCPTRASSISPDCLVVVPVLPPHAVPPHLGILLGPDVYSLPKHTGTEGQTSGHTPTHRGNHTHTVQRVKRIHACSTHTRNRGTYQDTSLTSNPYTRACEA